MIRSTLVLLALLAALPGCPGGASHGSDANVQPGTHQILILTPPGRTIRLAPGERVVLAVRYLDPQGVPDPGAQISFALEGEPGGATLGGFNAYTDASGTAEMELTAGAETALFKVRVSADNALPVHFEIAVSVTGFVNVEILTAYEGTRSASSFAQVTAELYYGDRCDDLNPVGQNHPDRARVTPDGFGAMLVFENLPADLDYAFAVSGTDAADRVLAWGCADVASLQLLPGATVQLGLSARDLVPDAAGVFQVSTTVELTGDQAAGVLQTLAPLAALGRCPLDPLQRLLDCIVDAAAPDGAADCLVESTAPLAAAVETLRGALDVEGCRGPVTVAAAPSLEALLREATDATGLVAHAALRDLAGLDPAAVQTFRLRSRLSLVPDPSGTQYLAWHLLEKLEYPDLAPGAWLPLSQLGGLTLEVTSLEAPLTVESPTVLHLPSHDVTLHPGRAALATAYAQLLAPAGLPPDLPGLVAALLASLSHAGGNGPEAGCAAMDAILCEALEGLAPCPQDACAQGVALLLDLAGQHWAALPPLTQSDLSLAADIPLTDNDGDLKVDQLGTAAQPLPWLLELYQDDVWSPPQAATFAATKIAPVPQ